VVWLHTFRICEFDHSAIKFLLYKIISRDAHFTVPTYDFFFKVNLPKANKERLIIKRDYLGRIVSSRVPEISFRYAEK